MYVLALETSTSSAKAMLCDVEAGTVTTAGAPYPPEICKDGMTDTRRVFEMACDLGRRLAAGKPVCAVALSATWCSVSVCDEAMRPATPTYNWNYMGPSNMCREVRANQELALTLYGRTGCMPHVTYPREILRYLGGRGVSLDGKLLPSQGAYNFYRLTGEFMESVCSVSGAGFINMHTLDYDDFALDYCGAKPDQFGTLCRYTQTRPLTEEGARLLGVDAGIPVVPAHADGALNQIGDGAAKKGHMTLSVGTSAALRLTTDKPVLPKEHSLWCYYGATDYIAGAATAGACNCINWFKDVFLKGMFSFEQLEIGVQETVNPPCFLPFLFGERCPGWRDDRLGVFSSIRPEHTISDLYLSVQQGILFGLFQCYEMLTANMGEPASIFLSGGILHSTRWINMAADLFGREMLVSENADSSLMGATLLGMHAAGAVSDIVNFEYPSASSRARITPDERQTRRLRGLYAAYLDGYDRSMPG